MVTLCIVTIVLTRPNNYFKVFRKPSVNGQLLTLLLSTVAPKIIKAYKNVHLIQGLFKAFSRVKLKIMAFAGLVDTLKKAAWKI